MKRNYTNLFNAVLLLTSLSSAGEIRLKNYAKNTSLNFRHDHGGSDQYYYVESIGAGACVFDYDGDGILDVYFPQGAPFLAGRKRLYLKINYIGMMVTSGLMLPRMQVLETEVMAWGAHVETMTMMVQ